jgi:hypothetical protein
MFRGVQVHSPGRGEGFQPADYEKYGFVHRALAAGIPRSRAADGPERTGCTDGSVHEPVHGRGARSLNPATVRNIVSSADLMSGAWGPARNITNRGASARPRRPDGRVDGAAS